MKTSCCRAGRTPAIDSGNGPSPGRALTGEARREQSSDEQPGLDGSFNDLIGASKQRLRHGET